MVAYTGFNVETVEYKNISFTVWDVGGQVSNIIIIVFFFLPFTFCSISHDTASAAFPLNCCDELCVISSNKMEQRAVEEGI